MLHFCSSLRRRKGLLQPLSYTKVTTASYISVPGDETKIPRGSLNRLCLYKQPTTNFWKHVNDGYAYRFTLFQVMTNLEKQIFHRVLNPIQAVTFKKCFNKYLKYHFRKLFFTEYFIFRMCWFDICPFFFFCGHRSVIPFSICRGHLKETKKALFRLLCQSQKAVKN